MPSHFKIKEYCPLVFRNLRERFGIDDVDYKESMTRYNLFFYFKKILIVDYTLSHKLVINYHN